MKYLKLISVGREATNRKLDFDSVNIHNTIYWKAKLISLLSQLVKANEQSW